MCAPVLAAAGPFDSQSTSPLASDEERGFTVPSDEREIAFPVQGLISEVTVKNGDTVKAGHVLATLDTEVEKAALAKEEYSYKSTVQNRAAVAQRDLAKVELDRVQKMFTNTAASQEELDKAKVELLIAELKIELAKEETEKSRLEIAKIKKQIERMRVVSKFNGVARKVDAAAGEVADPQKPSITIVSNDPLWVEVKLPIRITTAMKVGDAMQVRYILEQNWIAGKVVFFDPVADATTGTQLIRVEIPNKENRRSGYEMAVKLPVKVAAK